MKLIALRELYSPREYGRVVEGEVFEVRDEIALDLLRRDPPISRRADPPRLVYQTKIVTPQAFQPRIEAPEVRARLPFRELPVSDERQKGVATESDPLLSAADVPKPGDADRRGRRGRARSAAGE